MNLWFIHSSIGGHSKFLYILPTMKNAAVNYMCEQVAKQTLFLVLLGMYPGAELLDHMLTF